MDGRSESGQASNIAWPNKYWNNRQLHMSIYLPDGLCRERLLHRVDPFTPLPEKAGKVQSNTQ
jgi:hypothetical protein